MEKISIIVSANTQTLVISYVGYADQEVPLKGTAGEISIKMQNSNGSLGDLLVVAYGTAKKEAFTGSATFVKVEQLQRSITNNVAAGLQGLSPAVTNGQSLNRNLFLGGDAVVTKEWKLNKGELFRIEEDPIEKNNLAISNPQQLNVMLKLLEEF